MLTKLFFSIPFFVAVLEILLRLICLTRSSKNVFQICLRSNVGLLLKNGQTVINFFSGLSLRLSIPMFVIFLSIFGDFVCIKIFTT